MAEERCYIKIIKVQVICALSDYVNKKSALEMKKWRPSLSQQLRDVEIAGLFCDLVQAGG